MMPPATTSRRVRVREQNGRLLLTWYAGERATFAQIKEDLRQTFRRHRDRCWSRTNQAWSLPAHHRALLGEWLATWFTPEQTTWTVAPQSAPRETHKGDRPMIGEAIPMPASDNAHPARRPARHGDKRHTMRIRFPGASCERGLSLNIGGLFSGKRGGAAIRPTLGASVPLIHQGECEQ